MNILNICCNPDAITVFQRGKGSEYSGTIAPELGYRVVVPSDGSGQVLLVPPGEKLEGEEGAGERAAVMNERAHC
eukprot:1157407-Pelagomonas_calceolata.AAC.9